ncbi:MAG TPA: phosphopantetheine-binding protein [Chitinophagaceae bacterium]|nr:phosphopantetheine-binding protein [Chitinophagaceae bacterium]
MNETELKKIILQSLKKVAPDTNPEILQAGDKIREKLDMDSFDALRFIVELNEKTGVDIPEEDYWKIVTLKDLMHYIMKK